MAQQLANARHNGGRDNIGTVNKLYFSIKHIAVISGGDNGVHIRGME